MCVYMYVCPCVSYICSMYIYIYIYIHVYYDVGVFDQQIHMCVYYDYLTHSLGIQKGRAGTGSKLWVWPLSATKCCQANGASTDWLLFFFARVQFPRTTDDGIYIYISGRAICGIARHGTTLCQRGRACLILIYVIYIYI